MYLFVSDKNLFSVSCEYIIIYSELRKDRKWFILNSGTVHGLFVEEPAEASKSTPSFVVVDDALMTE